jgi:hypothetical protein
MLCRMAEFVFDPPLRLARDVTVRTLDDAAEFARTYVGPRLPHSEIAAVLDLSCVRSIRRCVDRTR